MPKVSVIIPVYNVEKYLRECLDSVINQTLADIEIIVVDDGSPDNCPQICDEYALKDNRIKVIHKENGGYGSAMNVGLDNATGDYIGILEPDDFVKNTMFEDLYSLADKNNLDMVKSDFYYYTTSNKSARQAGLIKKKNENKVLSAKDDIFMLKLPPSIWSAIYKRSFLNKNNIRFLETAGASFQDTSFAFKTLATAKRLMFTSKPYVYYRQDNENSSIHSKDKVYNICYEWEEITKYINKRPKIKEVVNQVKLSTQFNAYKWNLVRIDECYKDEFIEKYQQTFQEYVDNNEIQNDFYIKASKNELQILLNDKKAYRKFIDEVTRKHQEKNKRRKLFSIRINSSRISIVLFGKQIWEIAV